MQNQGLLMLDKALELATLEQKAMEKEDYDDAIMLSRQRGKITNEAWDFFQADFREEYRTRLLRLQNIHMHLKSLAMQAHEKVQASLQHSRNEKRRMRGYRAAVSHAL